MGQPEPQIETSMKFGFFKGAFGNRICMNMIGYVLISFEFQMGLLVSVSSEAMEIEAVDRPQDVWGVAQVLRRHRKKAPENLDPRRSLKDRRHLRARCAKRCGRTLVPTLLPPTRCKLMSHDHSHMTCL